MFYCRVRDTWHVTRGHCVAGGPAPHPDRQWHGRAGEWLDRETHHEENTRGPQPLRTWSGESTPQTCTSTVTTNTMFIGSQQEDWECVQQVQTHAAEERWHEQKGFNKHPCQVSEPHPRNCRLHTAHCSGLTSCWPARGPGSSPATPCAASTASSCPSCSTSGSQVTITITVSCLYTQGDYDGRGQQTASPMFTAIMSGGVGITGRELSLSCWVVQI